MNVPSEPSLAWISTILFLLGLFLFVSGLNIIKIEKLSVNHGFKAWFIGLLLMIVGIVVVIPNMLPQGKSVYSYLEKFTTEEKFIGIDKKLVKKAKAGDMDSQAELGRILWVEKLNFPESFIWDEKAAKQGHEDAQRRTGSHYEEGKGVKRNYEKAVYWYKESVRHRNIEASIKSLIEIYGNGGYGVKKNLVESYKWTLKYNDILPSPQDSSILLSSITKKLSQENNEKMDDEWKLANNGLDKLMIFHKKDKDFYFSSPDSILIGSLNKNEESNRYGGIIKNINEAKKYIGSKVRFNGNIAFSKYDFAYISMQALGKVENGKAKEYKYSRVEVHNTKREWKNFDLIMEIPEYARSINFTVYFYGSTNDLAWVDDIKIAKAEEGLEEKYKFVTTHEK